MFSIKHLVAAACLGAVFLIAPSAASAVTTHHPVAHTVKHKVLKHKHKRVHKHALKHKTKTTALHSTRRTPSKHLAARSLHGRKVASSTVKRHHPNI